MIVLKKPLLFTTRFAATVTLAVAMVFSTAAAVAQDNEIPEDLEAGLFMQKCFSCHQGLLSGQELTNTHQRTRESLEETVHRMQQYTGPLPEEQITQLVDLMKDEEFVFRIEEAKLVQEEKQHAQTEELSAEGEIDGYAMLFMRSCAGCHNIGLGNASGIDLIHTLNQDADQVRASVVRMQMQAGPLTDGQIDGLTALLKDQERVSRLASVGFKNAAELQGGSESTESAASSSTGTASGTTVPAAGQTDSQPGVKAEAHATSNFPTGMILGLLLVTVIAAIGCYFFVWRHED